MANVLKFRALILSMLALGEYIQKKENLILMGNSGTGKTHLATALGLLACQQGHKSRFFTAAGLINHLVESQAQLKLSQVERALEKADLVIIDEVGYVPFSEAGADYELLPVASARQHWLHAWRWGMCQQPA